MNIRTIIYAVLMAVCACMICERVSGQDLSAIADASPFTLNGSISAALTKYSMAGAPARREPTSWTVNGSFGVSIYTLQLPFNFVFSEQERGFRQPFNQFGISPSYKWATAHIGYRSMYISQYTLAGATFYGLGLELTPGPLRLAAMYGRLQREVEEDTLRPLAIPAYRRTGYALKLGFGSEATYVDLAYFHARDDTASLVRKPASVQPQENSVLSLVTRISMIPDNLYFDVEGAVSLYTRDMFAREMNLSSSEGVPDFLGNYYNVRSSTSALLAGRAGLNFTVPHFGLRAGFEYIEPDFTSLGAYYFNTDMANLTLEPQFDIDDNALRVSGSIGYQYDNLKNNKESTTDRIIGSANIGWSPIQAFGVDAQYSNYSTSQIAGLRSQSIPDTPRVRNVTQSVSIAPRVLVVGESLTHSFALAGSYQEYADRSDPRVSGLNTKARNVLLAYNVSFATLPLSLGLSVMASEAISPGAATNTTGGNLNSSVTLVDNKLSLALAAAYSHTTVDGTSGKADVFNQTVSASFRLTKDDVFNLQLNATENNSTIFSATTFTELTATLTYSRTFSFDAKELTSTPPPAPLTPPDSIPGGR